MLNGLANAILCCKLIKCINLLHKHYEIKPNKTASGFCIMCSIKYAATLASRFARPRNSVASRATYQTNRFAAICITPFAHCLAACGTRPLENNARTRTHERALTGLARPTSAVRRRRRRSSVVAHQPHQPQHVIYLYSHKLIVLAWPSSAGFGQCTAGRLKVKCAG